MIQEIITNKEKLATECTFVTPKKTGTWEHIVADLLDTAKAHEWNCSGLAANQIGYNKRIIVVKINNSFVCMINPEINPYGKMITKEESCLSFPGLITRKKRYNKVKISYFDPINLIKVDCLKLKGWESRATQHEVNHLDGICI